MAVKTNPTAGTAQKKPKLDPTQHYFWLDHAMADLPSDALKKRAHLLYLQLTRSCNPKWLNCSMASYRAARESVGLSRLAFDAAREELLQKGFIRFRPDVKPGYFKATPVEVLQFPVFDGSCFAASEDGPRSLRKCRDSVIFLPSRLLDEGWLKGLSHLELRTLLFLYAHCRLEECLGVDFQVVYAWNPKNPNGVAGIGKRFGRGFTPSLRGKECFEVVEPKHWWVSGPIQSVLGRGVSQALNSLVERGLLSYVPVVVWEDPEDKGIAEVRREVVQGCIRFPGEDGTGKYRLPPLEEQERVIWIVRPRYLAQNYDHVAFVDKSEEQAGQARALLACCYGN